MGLKGIFRFFLQRLLELTIIVLLITFIPNLPPHTSFTDRFRIPPTKPLEGKLAVTNNLQDVELWHKGELIGPEAFAEYNGEVYTSLYGGDVVKLTGNHITPVVKFGKPCKANYEERICGRPLGLAFDKAGNLYAADAYYGIFKVNVKTGEKVQLISPSEEINGRKTKLFNSLAVASNGDIYWSASSTEFSLEDGVFDFLADPSGRLIHYNAKTKKNTVLIDRIAFANGVILADDESFVLVAETRTNRILRYHLQGAKKGKHDVFIEGLPGMPDNITPDGQGGFLVALVSAVDKDHPQPFQAISSFPYIRKFIARVLGLSELLFATVNRIYPNEISQRAVHFIGHFSSVSGPLSPKRVTIVQLSKNGEVLSSIHNIDKKLHFISEAQIVKDSLYFGSPHSDYIGRIPLSKVGWEHLSSTRKKRDVPETPKTTTAAPKQETKTTQAPKPTPAPKQETKPTQTPKPTQAPKQEAKTNPPPPKQKAPTTNTTPPPPKQQTTQPPKTETTPPKQQTTTPPKQQTAPPKQQATTPPKQQTTTPPKQQTITPPKQQTTPPPKQQTAPPKQQTTPKQQQTTPPPKQQTPKPVTTAPPKKAVPTQKPTTPPQKQQTPPPTKEKVPPK